MGRLSGHFTSFPIKNTRYPCAPQLAHCVGASAEGQIERQVDEKGNVALKFAVLTIVRNIQSVPYPSGRTLWGSRGRQDSKLA